MLRVGGGSEKNDKCISHTEVAFWWFLACSGADIDVTVPVLAHMVDHSLLT